ncbi:hypothetical protein APR50_43060 [Variovorax paradoxus]|jgi:hypothetical protein|nr:hypothetical protein APR52_43575 [Variovorax paradoxus]KPU88993.1 hypothetical protein APR50_43060 [Variovorax paradoxus]KPU89225.1 hypothetical protein APR49_42645 [Variovorax paradoxus]KPV03737.1 hypothetical protein APR51_44620 [Variovorax paradoxus]KPV16528.1 hypothetical protein APR48_42765 [Variovorax paradoxus]
MPMDLLRRIERAALPLVLRDERDVRSTIVLEAAAMIKAHLPANEHMSTRPAVVFRITDIGRQALSELRPSDAGEPTRG